MPTNDDIMANAVKLKLESMGKTMSVDADGSVIVMGATGAIEHRYPWMLNAFSNLVGDASLLKDESGIDKTDSNWYYHH